MGYAFIQAYNKDFTLRAGFEPTSTGTRSAALLPIELTKQK